MLLTGVKQRFLVQLRGWLSELTGMNRLVREHEALSIRLRLVEQDLAEMIDEQDAPIPMNWAARTYRD
jgi:hypothetical protein